MCALQGWAEKSKDWKVLMIMSYLLIMSYNFFDHWVPSTATPMDLVRGPQGGRCWKINPIWSHAMGESWAAYDLIHRPSDRKSLYNICLQDKQLFFKTILYTNKNSHNIGKRLLCKLIKEIRKHIKPTCLNIHWIKFWKFKIWYMAIIYFFGTNSKIWETKSESYTRT